MLARREAVVAAALAPFIGGAAEACTIQLPLREPHFDKALQARRLATVNTFFSKVEKASGSADQDIDIAVAPFVRTGFKMPDPVPFKLRATTSFGELVLARAEAFKSTPDNECNPVTAVEAYYACFFDPEIGDRIAMMDTIIYG